MTVDVTGSSEGARSPVKILANIFISFIGAGVLGLPYAFKEAGILEGVLIMSSVGIVSVKAMLLLIDCKYKLIHKSPSHSTPSNSAMLKVKLDGKGAILEDQVELIMADDTSVGDKDEPSKPVAVGKDLTYGDLGYYALGHIGRTLVDITIVISQIGFCCAYIIFICENLSDYIHGLKLIHWLFILLPPLALLTFLRHLSSLAISSLFAQLSNLLAFAVVFWFDFEHFATVKRIHPKEISLRGFPFFLAVAIYCYEGAGMILSLESSLNSDIRHKFKSFFKGMMFVVTMLYIVFGSSGYLSFGPDTNEIITLNLPIGQSLDFAMVVKSCLCLALFFTYPVMMFPVIRILEGKLLTKPSEQIFKGNLLRILMVLMTGIVVMAVPNFANLMALIGATCCSLLAFILPGIFHVRIFRGSLTKCEFMFDMFLVTMGIAGSIVGTMDALVRLHGTHTGHPVTTSHNHTAEAILSASSTLLPPAGVSRNIISETVLLMMNTTTSREHS